MLPVIVGFVVEVIGRDRLAGPNIFPPLTEWIIVMFALRG